MTDSNVIFSQDDQVRLLLVVRRANPDDYPDPKTKAVIYKAQGITPGDRVVWSAQ